MTNAEKIEILDDILRHCQKHPSQVENAFYEDEDIKRYEFQSIILDLKKVLQIKPRTIVTIEVGDYIYTPQSKGCVVEVNEEYIETHQERFYKEFIEIIKITPHEWIELWGEMND